MSMTAKLNNEIDRRFDKLSELDASSEEYSAAINSVTKLMDRAIEIEKLDRTDAQNEKQLKEERKSRVVKNCIDVGSVILPLTLTAWGMLVSLKFEENGTITTTIGRKTLDRLFKK